MTIVRAEDIQIIGGKYVSVIDPDLSEVTIYDVAHALSNTGRYAGHTRFFYPVSQHSVLGTYQTDDRDVQWDFLVHDASEAFIVDIPSPLKFQLPDYRQLEKVWETRMSNKLDARYPLVDEVRRLDIEALATERRDLLHPNGEWEIIQDVNPWKEKIICWHPLYANYRFLKRAKELRPNSPIKVPSPILPWFIQGSQVVTHFISKVFDSRADKV